MKVGLIAVFIFSILIVLILLSSQTHLTKSSIDIHISDTYFVEDHWWSLLIKCFIFLLFIFGMTTSVSSKFKNKLHNRILAAGIFGSLSCFVYYYLLFSKS